ncbi:hypothetical protein [Actinocorallia lasiicapitis]
MVIYAFEPDRDGLDGRWTARCASPVCAWSLACEWGPYGDIVELAAFYLEAAAHERDA